MTSSYLRLPEKRPVLGIDISQVTFEDALDLFLDAAATRQKVRVIFCTVHGIITANHDPELRGQLASSQIVAPDGMPLVWLGRLRGSRITRVCGPDVLLALCERSQAYGYRHYFYGGNEGVAQQLAASLKERFPDLQVAGTYTPPFRPLTEEEDQQVVAEINEAKPDFVWVGLSTPKQDAWLATHQAKLDAPVLLAVGAAFNFYSGNVSRAPRWVQRLGFEWLYRLSQEPRRLWRRYLVTNSLFLIYLMAEVLRIRRGPK